jgi:thiol-disulfide isomerase/thioredoxin
MIRNLKIIFVFVQLLLTQYTVSGQEAPQPAIIKWESLEKILRSTSDTVYVINFWATWCKPCVAELPFFDSIAAVHKNKPISVVLVSLDFKRQYQDRLLPFLAKNNVRAKVLLLDEPDYNSWIEKVDKYWSGAIPATLIMHPGSGYREFFEKEFTFTELEKIILPLIKKT